MSKYSTAVCLTCPGHVLEIRRPVVISSNDGQQIHTAVKLGLGHYKGIARLTTASPRLVLSARLKYDEYPSADDCHRVLGRLAPSPVLLIWFLILSSMIRTFWRFSYQRHHDDSNTRNQII